MDRVNFSAFHTIHSEAVSASLVVNQEADDCSNALAIVPFKPTLHAVLITLWAQGQERVQSFHQLPAVPMTEESSVSSAGMLAQSAVSSQPSTQDTLTVTLPMTISVSHPNTPLEASSCRRSTRLSASKDTMLFELEDNPRRSREFGEKLCRTTKQV